MADLCAGGIVSQTLAADVREMVREQLDYRDLLFQITRRDLSLRYTQTIMGFGWAIFMPLVNTIIFSVVFTRVAPLDVGVPYPLFALLRAPGLELLCVVLRFSLTSLTSNTNLVAKVYFPREIFPFSAFIVASSTSLVGSLVLIGMMIYFRVAVTPAILSSRSCWQSSAVHRRRWRLILAMANLFYRDVKYIFEVIITFWMFATSVLYPVDEITGAFGAVIRLNPMTADRRRLPSGPALWPVACAGTLSAGRGPFRGALLSRWSCSTGRSFRFAESV